MTIRSLSTHLEARFPGMVDKVLRSSAITVNLEYVDFDPDELGGAEADKGKGAVDGGEGGKEAEGLDLVIQPGDEVGIIPPVSSG